MQQGFQKNGDCSHSKTCLQPVITIVTHIEMCHITESKSALK